MARAGFYNENEYRDYPFLTQVAPFGILREEDVSLSSSSSLSSESSAEPLIALPHEAIVDFGAIMGIRSGFDEQTDWVYLYRITYEAPYFIFEFRNTACNESIFFIRHQGANPWTISWETSRPPGYEPTLPSSQSSFSSSSSSAPSEPFNPWDFEPCEEPCWEAYIVTGFYNDLLDMMSDGDTIYFHRGVWTIEPCRVQSLVDSFVASINLANRARKHVTLPERCRSSSSSSVADEDPVHLNRACLLGDLKFKGGYNCIIRQEDGNNAIVIDGAVGGGDFGQPCEEFPYYPGEEKPEGSKHYSGGPTCGEIAKTINGKGGRTMRLDPGPGFNISTDPDDPSLLIVNADMDDLLVECFGDSESSSEPITPTPESSVSSVSSVSSESLSSLSSSSSVGGP